MTKYPRFSVLMSVYKNEKTESLDDCLASIAAQSLTPSEVIIVLDGPVSEDILVLIANYRDKLNITEIPLIENVGLGSALNIGMRYCKSDVIVRMDTDDICDADRFYKQINYMGSNPNISLLGSAVEEFNEDFSVSHCVKFSVMEHNAILKYAKARNPFNHMSVAFKKDDILSVGGYIDHKYMEDYNLWLRVLAHGYQTHNLEDVLVYVRAGDAMISRRKGRDYIKSEYQLLKLKIDLNIDKKFHAIIIFVARSLPRILPVYILKYMYSFLRKNRT